MMDAATNGGALFASITCLDGAFGLLGKGIDRPVPGGLAGLVKTAAIEWPEVVCRAIDISPDWQDFDRLATAIGAALRSEDTDGGIEIGLCPDLPANTGYRLNLEPASCPEGSASAEPSGRGGHYRRRQRRYGSGRHRPCRSLPARADSSGALSGAGSRARMAGPGT